MIRDLRNKMMIK